MYEEGDLKKKPHIRLEEGDTILLFVSLGKEVRTARVPDGLVGEKYTTAVTILNNNGFEKVTAKEEPSLEEEGTVTRLSVEPGSEQDVTQEIIVYYSSGEIIERMPNVIGLAAGQEKIEAIRAVLRGGYLDILITDETTANLLLKDE